MEDLKKGILVRNGVCVGALSVKYFSTCPLGVVQVFSGNTIPRGYLACDGASYPTTEYPDLYAVIGNTYGGDTENFNVPDYRETVLVGVGQNTTDTIASHDVYGLGEFKDDQMQSHTHGVTIPNMSNGSWSVNPSGSAGYSSGTTTQTSTASGTGTTTHGKQKGVTYIIKAFHTNEGVDSGVSDDVIEYVEGELTEVKENIETKLTEHIDDDTIHLTVEDVIEAAATTIANPNLLINPDFKINQRGQTEYTQRNAYTVDGWKLHASEGSMFNAEAKTLTIPQNDTSAWYGIVQNVKYDFAGKTVTMSAEVETDVDIYARITYGNQTNTDFTWLIPAGHSGIVTLTAAIPDTATGDASGCYTVQITNRNRATTGGQCKIGWVKLELGAVATSFVPPDPATELAKCQRYYIPANLTATMMSVIANELFFLCPLPTKMRTRPSLTSDVAFKMYRASDNAYIGDEAEWDIRVHTNSPTNGIIFALAKTAHGVTAGERYLTITAGGLSAEL